MVRRSRGTRRNDLAWREVRDGDRLIGRCAIDRGLIMSDTPTVGRRQPNRVPAVVTRQVWHGLSCRRGHLQAGKRASTGSCVNSYAATGRRSPRQSCSRAVARNIPLQSLNDVGQESEADADTDEDGHEAVNRCHEVRLLVSCMSGF